MNLKVGDKVIIIDCPSSSKVGKMGVIIDVYFDSKFSYRVKVGKCWSCPMYKHEIEPVPRKGEQLLFAFMNDVGSTQEEQE